jgi:hypothetical protein
MVDGERGMITMRAGTFVSFILSVVAVLVCLSAIVFSSWCDPTELERLKGSERSLEAQFERLEKAHEELERLSGVCEASRDKWRSSALKCLAADEELTVDDVAERLRVHDGRKREKKNPN